MRSWVACLATAVVVTSGGSIAFMSRQGPQVVTAAADAATEIQTTTTTSSTTTTRPPETTTTTPGEPQLRDCHAEIEPVQGDPVTDWPTLVLDPSRKLPDGFEPGDLVDVSRNGGTVKVREHVAGNLNALLDAADANDTPLTLISGFRSQDYQATLFENQADEVGEEEAEATQARPGHSEHQLGTAIDVLPPDVGELSAEFADTPAGVWLADHAAEFGFVVSYPEGTRQVSCYEFEPWHLRYVGKDVAGQIRESGLTPREWMLQQDPDHE